MTVSVIGYHLQNIFQNLDCIIYASIVYKRVSDTISQTIRWPGSISYKDVRNAFLKMRNEEGTKQLFSERNGAGTKVLFSERNG